MRLFTAFSVAVALLLARGAAWCAPPIAAYGKLPALDLVRLSPSGDKIAFIAVDGDDRRLFVRNVGGEAVLVDPVGNNKIRALRWAGDDYLLVLASATAKFGTGALDKWSYSTRAELFVDLIVDLKNHTLKKMFDHHELQIYLGAIGRDYGPRKIDGHWYEFVQAFSTDKWHMNVYKVDLETGKFTVVTPNSGDDFGYFIDQGGGIGARDQYNETTKTWSLFVGDHGTQVVTRRSSPLWTVGFDGPGRTPGSVLIGDSTDKADTFDEFPITSGAAATPLFGGLRIEKTLHDPESGLLIGGLIDGGQSAVLFDPKLQRRFDAARKAFSAYQVTLESYSKELARMVVKTDAADDSGTFWLIDMTTGKADELTAAYPAIGQADVGPSHMFAYKSADGLAIEGVLTLPPGSTGKGLPLVVMPHGGPIGVNDKVGFDWWAQAFASRGYAVLQPNYRGSSGYGVPFRNAGLGEWGRKILTDMSDGVAALAAAGIVDARRVCIVGASYGGYAALAGVTIQQGLYRCAVSVAGPSEVSNVMARDGDSDHFAGGRLNQKMFGVRSAGDFDLERISPLNLVDRADAPVLLIHGKDDSVVPYVHSFTMNDALQKAGKTSQLVTLEGEDHWLSRETTRVQTLEASVGWVEKYNPAH
jgi:dipeptidyl aminopeptidase/acylaminoacyl peptidase